MAKEYRYYQGMVVSNESSGGSGGTSNYNDLTNKPSIDNVELVGNKTAEALGLTSLDVFTAEIQTLTGELSQFKNYVDSIFVKRENEVDLLLSENIKIEFVDGTNYINVVGIGKTINFSQGLKVEGSEVALKKDIPDIVMTPSANTTSIKLGNDLAANQLIITDNASDTNITTFSSSEIGINHLFVKDDEDTDIITISSGYGTIELKGLDIKISSGGNSALISFIDGQLAINGKKILTE